MSTRSLPAAGDSYFFRSAYLPEAIQQCHKEVFNRYKDEVETIPTFIDGDYRGKDTFSLRCVELEAAVQERCAEENAVEVVKIWNPITRRDMRPDDVAPSQSIQYDPFDAVYLQRLIAGDRSNGLSVNAAKRAQNLLNPDGAPVEMDQRVALSDEFIQSLGTFEQVDVSAPLRPEQKAKIPSVHSTQNIWHYLDSKQQNQFAQNLQDTQAEGSYLVVGITEAATMSTLPYLLQRHKYEPHAELNAKIINQMRNNVILKQRQEQDMEDYKIDALDPFVYQKTQ